MRKAVITGCGTLSPLGRGVDAFWRGLLAGRSGIRPISSFDAGELANAMAGEVQDFVPERDLAAGESERFDRISQFAMVAAREALREAALEPERMERSRLGVIVATSLGGMLIGEAYQQSRHEGSPFPARRLLQLPYYAVAARLAREIGAQGPVVSPSIACASGTHAVGLALELIRLGHGDVFVVGGVETICPFIVSGFNCLRATTSDLVRPFDARRSGLLIGEGAAILVIEEAERARARGASIAVEVAGTGSSGDAVHMTAPARDGAGAVRAMRRAMEDAGVAPGDIDFVSAHGTGTPYNDAMESVAIAAVLGESVSRVPVNSIKGAIGHTLGAAGGFEAIMCRRILLEGVVPPTVNCEEPEPSCRLDLVRGGPRAVAARTVLSTSSAFAGNNAAVVLRRGGEI